MGLLVPEWLFRQPRGLVSGRCWVVAAGTREPPGARQQQELEAQTQVTLRGLCVTRVEERGLMRNERVA